MVSVKEIEEDFQLGASKSDLSEFRPTRILPRYEILFCKGRFPSVFCDRYFDRSKGLTERGTNATERGPTGEARRDCCWQCFCNVAEKRFGLFLQCG